MPNSCHRNQQLCELDPPKHSSSLWVMSRILDVQSHISLTCESDRLLHMLSRRNIHAVRRIVAQGTPPAPSQSITGGARAVLVNRVAAVVGP